MAVWRGGACAGGLVTGPAGSAGYSWRLGSVGGSVGGMLQACAERRHRRCTARSGRGSPAHLRLMPHHPRRIECSPACEKCWTQSAIPSSPGPSPHLLHAHPRRASSPPHTTLHRTTPHYTTLIPQNPTAGNFHHSPSIAPAGASAPQTKPPAVPDFH